MRRLSKIILLLAAAGLASRAADFSAAGAAQDLTRVDQFQTLPAAAFLEGCDFHLTGVITLVDTNRNLVVLQDATGAVALHFAIEDKQLPVGHLVTLAGSNCSPYFENFPDFPYHPSGWDIQSSFEAPMNWGEYHLTRMRGYLRPPVTGLYQFWIASDNSSELWLSTGASPAQARRIATIARFGWVDPHQWSKLPSQRSELIPLKAGEVYYIEALQEQTDQAEHLSVAWQIPPPNESAIEVIQGRYLLPWREGHRLTDGITNGILREYWTNYTAGDLTGMGGSRSFESALSIRNVQVTDHGPGAWPAPEVVSLSQRLSPENNYRWVRVEGMLKFMAADESGYILEISDGLAQTMVRVLDLDSSLLKDQGNNTVRVEGVCEGTHDQNNSLMPGFIWVSGTNGISFIENATTNAAGSGLPQSIESVTAVAQPLQGFYGTLGVVTFNDRVFDHDYIFIQENAAVMRVNIVNRPFKSRLMVGQRVDLGGTLEPGKTPPVITPVYVAYLGRQPLPQPIVNPFGSSRTDNQEGKWSEIEGVVHSVDASGTLSVVTKDGPAFLWLGQTPTNLLAGYVDAKIRARGVLMMNLLEAPTLLVPARSFLELVKAPPEDVFGIPLCSIASLQSKDAMANLEHRVRIVGEITYLDTHSFFIQDASGGIRVQGLAPTVGKTGETVEVAGFLSPIGFVPTLTEPVVQPAKPVATIRSCKLDLNETLGSRQKGSLVHVTATLLAEKSDGNGQTLELQEQQRVFVATLATSRGHLPELLPGSRLQITGVRDDELPAPSVAGSKSTGAPLPFSLTILLRNPQDVNLLSGPPWWTWKKTATLVVTLLTVLSVTLLWIHLLHRRLLRQQAARLAFSRLVFERLEDERRRIAVNLHDSLGQTLLLIKNNAILANQSSTGGQGTRNRLDEISGTTTQAIEEVRRITHGLRPYQLDRLGLSQAIRTMVNQSAENSQISFACRVDDIDGQLDKEAEMHVYRIVQEAVNNVVKHSGATESAVVIKKRANSLSLSVRDNGKGFDPVKLSSKPLEHGFGLTGISERILILKGTLHVDSKPSAGTSLTMEVPLKKS